MPTIVDDKNGKPMFEKKHHYNNGPARKDGMPIDYKGKDTQSNPSGYRVSGYQNSGMTNKPFGSK